MTLSYRPSDLSDSEEEDDQIFHSAIIWSEENDPDDWEYIEWMENGGSHVDWEYWLSLPVWNSRQAACLLNGIDPLIHDGTKPRIEPLLTARTITRDHLIRIKKYEDAARADEKAGQIAADAGTSDWIAWANYRNFRVWPGLHDALEAGVQKKTLPTKHRNAKLQAHAERIARERKQKSLPCTKKAVITELLKDEQWKEISSGVAHRNIKMTW